MKILSICLGLCAVGVLMLFASSVWKKVVADRVVWSEEQAVTHMELGAKFHQAAHAHGAHNGHDHGHDGHDHGDSVSAAEVAAAQKAWKDNEVRLEAARARREFWHKLLYRGGIGAIVLGGVGYFIAKNVMEDQD